MKILPVANCLLIAAGLIQTAVGLNCASACAACWKDGSTTGEDIKISCSGNGYCGNKCPQGYSDMHCAKSLRCEYVGYSKCGSYLLN